MRKQPKRSNKQQRRGSTKERDNFQDAAMEREFKKGERSEAAKFGGRSTVSTSNDPQWYFKDKNILNDVASFSFNSPVGAPLRMGNFIDDTIQYQDVPFQLSNMTSSVPGLMSIMLNPAFGVATGSQSPVNLAATNVYSYVRYKNSGAANYDSPDLMLYLMAMDSVYSCWNWLKRLYGMATTYSSLNRYRPRAYFKANGVDIDDFYAHLADFRGWLNVMANNISVFNVPATMTYMVRHSWLYSNIYMDGNTQKAQEYMYVPGIFYQFSETTSESGGELVPVNVLVGKDLNTATLMTVEQLKAILIGMVDALAYSEDIGIMSGDILKAYGEGNLFKLSNVDPDYKVEPVYSQEVLSQIENLQIVTCNETDLATLNIGQDPNTNYLTYEPHFTSGPGVMRKGVMINMHHSGVTPEEVMVATRLAITVKLTEVSETNKYYEFTSVGSEYAVGGYIWINAQSTSYIQVPNYTKLDPQGIPLVLGFTLRSDTTAHASNDALIWGSYIGLISMFDWHPFIFLFTNTGEKEYMLPMMGDLDMYTFISNDNLEAVNNLAILTEFNVPN